MLSCCLAYYSFISYHIFVAFRVPTTCTTDRNANGSLAARSANILRSSSIPDLRKCPKKSEYLHEYCLTPAWMRWIQSLCHSRFFRLRSRYAYCHDFWTRRMATLKQFLARPLKPLACTNKFLCWSSIQKYSKPIVRPPQSGRIGIPRDLLSYWRMGGKRHAEAPCWSSLNVLRYSNPAVEIGNARTWQEGMDVSCLENERLYMSHRLFINLSFSFWRACITLSAILLGEFTPEMEGKRNFDRNEGQTHWWCPALT